MLLVNLASLILYTLLWQIYCSPHSQSCHSPTNSQAIHRQVDAPSQEEILTLLSPREPSLHWHPQPGIEVLLLAGVVLSLGLALGNQTVWEGSSITYFNVLTRSIHEMRKPLYSEYKFIEICWLLPIYMV